MPSSLKNLTRLGKVLYPSLTWNLPEKEKILYLTFDDGPIPEVTPWVLSLLKEYNAQATFFCIGENVEKNLGIFNRILAEGHSVGNHTFNHLNGWKTTTKTYLENVRLAEKAICAGRTERREQRKETFPINSSPPEYHREKGNRGVSTIYNCINKVKGKSVYPEKRLFRPPYGRITPSQIKKLKQLDYEIVMWDVVSMDFNQNIPAEKCLRNVTENSGPGSIIVFHDSLKAEKNLKKVLPEILAYFKKEGYRMDLL